MLHSKVKTYLEGLKQEQKFDAPVEHSIAQKIEEILKNDPEHEPTREDIAEQMAFDFMEDYPNDDTGWKTDGGRLMYYGPMFVLPDNQNQMKEYPSITQVTEEVLEYWGKRAEESTHPILSSRYADLIVDFSYEIIGKEANISFYQIVIDSNIQICEKSLVPFPTNKTKARRALSLAVYKKDPSRINKVKDAIIKLGNEPGCKDFAFKLLLLDFPKQVILSEREKENLIKETEEYLEKIEKNPHIAEHYVSCLAEYYAKEKDEDNLMRVLSILEKSLKMHSQLSSEALLTINVYKQIQEIYWHYASKFKFNEAKKSSERISREFGQLDLDINKSLQRKSIEININQTDIDKYINSIFDEKGNNELTIIMGKIAFCFLLRENDIGKSLADISSKHPLQFLCSQQIISDKNIPIATLGSLKDDYYNHLQNHAKQYILFNYPFLSSVIDELKRQFSEQVVLEYFCKADLFRDEEEKYIERAISGYWRNDYLVSSSLFVPLIESSIRRLIGVCGGSTLKLNHAAKGYDYISLCPLLKENKDILSKVFSEIGDISFYFRFALTEKLGMNLRNNLAHGIGLRNFFRRDISDILFHVLICLSLVKKKEDNQ